MAISSDVVNLDDGAGADRSVVLSFRSVGEELEILRHPGHPFFVLGWGCDALGMVLGSESDWDEGRELVIERFCSLALVVRSICCLDWHRKVPGADSRYPRSLA